MKAEDVEGRNAIECTNVPIKAPSQEDNNVLVKRSKSRPNLSDVIAIPSPFIQYTLTPKVSTYLIAPLTMLTLSIFVSMLNIDMCRL